MFGIAKRDLFSFFSVEKRVEASIGPQRSRARTKVTRKTQFTGPILRRLVDENKETTKFCKLVAPIKNQ
jgi:hypothetical protein